MIFAGLITSTKNVQKSFQCDFCNQWNISFILKSFYQIPLTWSKIYLSQLEVVLEVVVSFRLERQVWPYLNIKVAIINYVFDDSVIYYLTGFFQGDER